MAPFVEAMAMVDGRATAYVCRDFACRQPATTGAEFALREPVEAANCCHGSSGGTL